MPLTAYALNRWAAPGMSVFTTADIPDMSEHDDQSSYWLQNFILNSMFRVSISSPHREYLFNFLRRSVDCFREHNLAREVTLDYLGAERRSTSQYFLALHHWEAFLSAAWHAHVIVGKLSGERPFQKGDHSLAECVNHMYNRLKHADTAIAAGQLPPDGTVPVWLTNDGLASTERVLTWTETAQVLEEIARAASVLQDPQPPDTPSSR